MALRAKYWKFSGRGSDRGATVTYCRISKAMDDRLAIAQPITDWSPPLICITECGSELHDVPWEMSIDESVVVSKKVKDILDTYASEQVQCLPLVTHNCVNPEKVIEYFIVNPLVKLDCLDYNRSEYHKDGYKNIEALKFMVSMYSVIIDETKVPSSCRVFRMKNLLGKIIITSTIKKEFAKAGVTGMYNVPVYHRLPDE